MVGNFWGNLVYWVHCGQRELPDHCSRSVRLAEREDLAPDTGAFLYEHNICQKNWDVQ